MNTIQAECVRCWWRDWDWVSEKHPNATQHNTTQCIMYWLEMLWTTSFLRNQCDIPNLCRGWIMVLEIRLMVNQSILLVWYEYWNTVKFFSLDLFRISFSFFDVLSLPLYDFHWNQIFMCNSIISLGCRTTGKSATFIDFANNIHTHTERER